jgi:hypothetical protein
VIGEGAEQAVEVGRRDLHGSGLSWPSSLVTSSTGQEIGATMRQNRCQAAAPSTWAALAVRPSTLNRGGRGRAWACRHREDDARGALLYPGETGPFVPRSDRRNGRSHAQDLLELPNEAFDQNPRF